MDNKFEAADRVKDIQTEIEELVMEARGLVMKFAPNDIDNLDAYVFEQITEHCHKTNPYNTDLGDVAIRIEES